MVAIELQHVSKRYLLHRRRQLVTQHAWNKIRRITEPFWALRDISFQVHGGERVAIVGANGAGKSTLLSIVAGVTHATSGKVRRRGRVGALLEIGTGFHPDLTARENIHLNASLLGLSRQEVAAKFDSIVAFSEIEEFLDEPIRTYSSGMIARLGFAIAIQADPDVLLLDEVFAVGDESFQAKCTERVTQLAGEGKTLLFVSHGLQAVLTMCPRALWLDHGRLRLDGSVEEVVEQYRASTSGVRQLARAERG